MPKKKKQKPSHQNHNSSSDPNAPLSHNEIWDDSFLVSSWNAAVKEYEYYHSLAAQGLDPDEVLDAAEDAEDKGEDVDLRLGEAEAGEAEGGTEGPRRVGGAGEDDVEEGEVEDEAAEERLNGVDREGTKEAAQIGPQLPTTTEHEQQGGAGNAKVQDSPDADLTLENVKMAYYWAGYYSGLYDAQKHSG